MASNLYLSLKALWILLSVHKYSSAVDRDSFDCDFDDGFCNWKQDKTDDFDWTRMSGKTPTPLTGPDSDHTSGEGFYVYIETTPEKVGDYMNNSKARLISPQRDPGQYCFSLWYYMYGRHINRLSVSKKEGADTKELFLKTGQQGKRWILMQVQFDAKESFQIVIEGKTRDYWRNWYGDIAIDDMVMFPSAQCPTDPESSSLIAVYTAVPVVAVILAILSTVAVCRKWRLKCSTILGIKNGKNKKPVIPETTELENVANNYEHLNRSTIQTATVGSTLPDNEYAVLSNTENDHVVNVYYSTGEAEIGVNSSVNLDYENAGNFALPFGGLSNTKCSQND